jgi:hypothetical protein
MDCHQIALVFQGESTQLTLSYLQRERVCDEQRLNELQNSAIAYCSRVGQSFSGNWEIKTQFVPVTGSIDFGGRGSWRKAPFDWRVYIAGVSVPQPQILAVPLCQELEPVTGPVIQPWPPRRRAPPRLGAKFMGQEVPKEMEAGKEYTVIIKMKNTGSEPWTAKSGYELAALPINNETWGITYVQLSPEDQIGPNQTKDFKFNVTAPTNSKMEYLFQWQMHKTGAGCPKHYGKGCKFGNKTTENTYIQFFIPKPQKTPIAPPEELEESE